VITIRSYQDEQMAGMPRENRERGKWFIHDVGDTADLVDIVESLDEAKEIAKEQAHSEDAQTDIKIRNEDGTEVQEWISTDTHTFE
jgi:hypothetical protein